jgi:hypothetical protein
MHYELPATSAVRGRPTGSWEARRPRTRVSQHAKCSVTGPGMAKDSLAEMTMPHCGHGAEAERPESGVCGFMTRETVQQQCRAGPSRALVGLPGACARFLEAPLRLMPIG